jgi:hypothetical protein
MARAFRAVTTLACLACLCPAARAADFQIPLACNWNGIYHAGEIFDPDAPMGFRAIADRAFYADSGDPRALGSAAIVGATGISYSIVQDREALDIVHLGNTGTGTTRTWDTVVGGGTANRGVMPAWLPSTNAHTFPQVTDVSSQNLVLDANSSLGFLYHVTNGGGQFQVLLTFTDSSTVTLTLGANDWFGPTNPPAPLPGVASQSRLGGTTFTGTSNTDAPTIQVWPTQALAVTEAVITPQSIAAAGLGNVVGRQLASITFQNANQPTRGYAIYAATVVTGLGPPANDACQNALAVQAGQTDATNVRATGSEVSACGSGDTADVWFRFTATASGPIEARTCGAAFDTTISIHTSCGGAAIACDNNGCGLASRVRWNAVAAQEYLIRVAGNSGATGSFTLTIDTNPPTHVDVQVPLAYNWNGIVHPGESGQPDAPNGYRSISDRGLHADGNPGAINAGALLGTDFIPYAVVNSANALDLVHLGLTGPGSPRQWDAAANGDGRGTQPSWLTSTNQSGLQRTNLAPLNIAMGASTRVGVLYHVSNGGGSFDVTLEFSDSSTAVVNVQAPDWYLEQTPPAPTGALEVQRQLGVFSATAGQDLATTGAPVLNVVEAVFSTASLLSAGQGDVSGKRLTGLTISNGVNSSASGFAVFAATFRDPVPNSDPVPPSGVGSTVPGQAEAGRSVLLRVAAAPGQNPASTGLMVACNLSAIGGSAAATMFDDGTNGDVTPGDLTFSLAFSIPAGQSPGEYPVPFTVTDAQSRSGSGSIPLLVVPYAWNEQTDGGGDAGDLPVLAQVPHGVGALGAIAGDLSASDVDMYAFDICEPSAFSATTVGGTTTDTQLFLFDSSGRGVAFNDDSSATLQSTITSLFVPGAGSYYLAVSRFDRDAIDEGGMALWLDTPYGVERAPDGPGALNPVAGWDATTVAAGGYRIALAGACFRAAVGCDPDFNQDGNADQDDVAYLVNVVAGGENPTGRDPDFNRDGNVDQDDTAALINVVAGGNCP